MKKKRQQIKHRPGTLERRAKKNKVRASPEWKELRKRIFKRQKGIDPVTLRPLTHGWNNHHLSQNDEHYGDLRIEKFVGVNSKSHSILHFLYDIVHRENSFAVLNRIKKILISMDDWTKEDSTKEGYFDGIF